MLYLKSSDGAVKVVILEQGNLDQLKQGRPAKTPDGTVLIAFTPDPVWLADRLMDCDGDATKIAELIDEAGKRPPKPADRPPHKLHLHRFTPEGT
jgi:hypothetical protein